MSSEVLKDINDCNLAAVAADFLHFVKGGAGLVTQLRRSNLERFQLSESQLMEA
jgi:hypothetical protein